MNPRRRPAVAPPFALPPDVTVARQARPDGVAYRFRHRRLGLLGHLVVTAHGANQTRLSSEVAGHPDDPMTAERLAILRPLAEALTRVLDARTGGQAAGQAPPASAPSPDGPHRIASKLMQCEGCGAPIALLIFADDGELEDHARLMHEQIVALGLPTWVVGPPRGDGPLDRRLAETRKVYPQREPVCQLSPEEFAPLIDALRRAHCPPQS